MKKKQPIQATLPKVAPAKKPARKAKPAKKPAARQIPPPPPGWEIVGKDDPRLKNLPCKPMCLHKTVGWIPDPIADAGKTIDVHSRDVFTFALPIATPTAPQPPMIRLRLPSEKPTMEDGDADGDVMIFFNDGIAARPWDMNMGRNAIAWLPGRLPEGILPREPSQEEKWWAEGEKLWPAVSGEMTASNSHEAKEAFLRGFLAAKKGGAE